MEEIWEDVQDYIGLYEISSEGRVRSVRNNKDVILNTIISRYGYIKVRLSKNTIKKEHFVHRLIAIAFIPNPFNYPYIDHIDTIRTNNSVTNLKWVTSKQNSNNPLTLQHLRNNAHSKSVCQKDIDGNIINIFPSILECSRQTGFNNAWIGQCCNGHITQFKGYIWEFI